MYIERIRYKSHPILLLPTLYFPPYTSHPILPMCATPHFALPFVTRCLLPPTRSHAQFCGCSSVLFCRYELPFNGRANFASERNFQLVSREGGMGEVDRLGLPKQSVLLLHGKLEDNPSEVFALDFGFPFSPLSALAVVASSWSW